MKRAFFKSLLWVIALALCAAPAWAEDKNKKSNGKNQDRGEPAEQAAKAAQVLKEIMGTPDKAIPDNLLESASCIAVFPSVVKGGFIVGARYGRGVVSCRLPQGGWSAPLFLSVGGGSVGFQIGAQATDLVLLGMNPSTVEMFTKKRFELGGDASVAAGPVGRTAEAATDLPTVKTQFLSYSRSRGLFAGISLEGAVLHEDNDTNKAAYGPNYSSADILKSGAAKAPPGVKVFTDTIAKYAPPKKVALRK